MDEQQFHQIEETNEQLRRIADALESISEKLGNPFTPDVATSLEQIASNIEDINID